ncbi:SKT5 protein [Colletotrichum higginsianum IMI 349063]|uniref:SKT5 protein n=2 Tax=Colletotrichum higginsianum TaxID=80884 RepID=A0A1B7Y190_COLHI|nr:SKT5 protein [Colletotrichum higginsianum IMI 349063]OBR05768.1 SKT5 protein [Colletotrichum higginsianum IMI 349063]TIC90625.1 Chitin synthase regulatory factor 3 [Colletotrichum higginsianum]
MAGYPGQRPYGGGPPAPRPGPGSAPPSRGPPPQQYDNYQQDAYGYDYYDDGGYGPEYGGQYQDPNYARGPPPPNQGYPPQDYYAGGPGTNGPPRGGRPPQMGRGGPIPRPPTADGTRGAHPPRGGPGGRGGFPMGRGGRPAQYERSANSEPTPNRHRPQDPGPLSPPGPQGFGGAFPAFPGQGRKTDLDAEAAILNKMAGMDITGSQRPSGPPNGRVPPPRDPRRGPDPGYGPDLRGDGYGPPGPPRDDFGPPSRSMTMPVNDGSQRRAPPPRMDPYGGGPPGPPRNGVPPRPSTAQGNRPPPQRMYPPNPMPQPPLHQPQQHHQHQQPPLQHGGYGGEYDGGQDPYRDTRASFGDVYDAYYHSTRMSNQSNASYAQHDVPDFNAAPANGPRESFDQHMRPGIAQHTQPGAKRVPEMSRTKSQPDLRQSQQAVFEMAGDAPPMPPMDNGYQEAYNGQNGWDQPQNPQMGRPGMPQGPSPNRGPDSLPSHPAPVRPGHMPNSMVNMNDKPAPIRNYSGASNVPTPPAGPGGAPPPQQQMLPHQPSKSSLQDITTPVTQEELERLRQTIKSNPNDQESALRLAKRLVEAADVLAPALADPKMRTRGRERYLADANKILKKLSSAQNPEAMFFFADCLGRGLFGLEPDNKEAFTLYQSAAKLGHAAAAYRTAVCCEIGHEEGGGTRKDPLKAIQWYKRAATLGDTPAMYKVGMILLKGLLGQQKNPREAVGWLKRAAERADAENPHALHELGLLYESAAPNDAIIKDEAYAFTLFRQAADLGYKFSQYRLGCAFEYGLMGCPVDPRQSIMWYSRAAQQGEHQSELSLSGWYLTGSDNVLQQSDTEAYLWARKAATAGLAKAEYAMGYFTEVGIGVPANMEDAKRWYWRAAAQDFPKARERLEDLKRAGKGGPRQRERISRSKIGKQQEGECSVM